MPRLIAALRRHLLALIALLVVVAGTSYATAGGVTKRPDKRIYVCASNKGKLGATFKLSSAKARCAKGSRKLSWSAAGSSGLEGQAGPAGPPGDDGATGPRGATGETGPAGSGAPGPKGDAGAAGAAGAVGPAGPAGPQGAKGDPGTTGGTGAAGPKGDTGAVGPNGAPLLTSSGPVSLTTIAGGLVGTVGRLPLSGYAPGGLSDDQAAQVVPIAATFTKLRMRGTTTLALSLIGSTLTIKATLYRGTGDGSYTATALSCDASPGLTGILALNTRIAASCTGTAAFAAGDVGFVQISATASGLSLLNTVSLNATAAIA